MSLESSQGISEKSLSRSLYRATTQAGAGRLPARFRYQTSQIGTFQAGSDQGHFLCNSGYKSALVGYLGCGWSATLIASSRL